MTKLHNPARRGFLKSSAAAGGALVIGVALPLRFGEALAATDSAMNAWIRIGSDNKVTILVARSEMGQGVAMAMPTIAVTSVARTMKAALSRREMGRRILQTSARPGNP